MSTNDEACAVCGVNHHAPGAPPCRSITANARVCQNVGCGRVRFEPGKCEHCGWPTKPMKHGGAG